DHWLGNESVNVGRHLVDGSADDERYVVVSTSGDALQRSFRDIQAVDRRAVGHVAAAVVPWQGGDHCRSALLPHAISDIASALTIELVGEQLSLAFGLVARESMTAAAQHRS